MESLALILGYRNRELIRVRRCLDSLSLQDDLDFEVIFIDYGSKPEMAREVKKLTSQYSFVNYYYSYTEGWFWNRSHALNTGVKLAQNAKYIITTDIDLIFPKGFIRQIKSELSDDLEIHATANNLPRRFNKWQKLGNSSKSYGKARNNTALGLVQGVKRKVFETLKGFDEYYCIWGAEDEDLNERMKISGIKTKWIDFKSGPIYHQWHEVSGPRSFNLPSRWQEVLVTYKNMMKGEMVRNKRRDWGRLITIENRPLLKFLQKLNDIKQIELQKFPASMALLIISDKLNQSKDGEILRFTFNDPMYEKFRQSKLLMYIERVNLFLDRMNLPFLLTNDLNFYKRYQNVFDYRDVIAYYLLDRRYKIKDYFLKFHEGYLEFIVMK